MKMLPNSTLSSNSWGTSTLQPRRILKFLLVLQGQKRPSNQSSLESEQNAPMDDGMEEQEVGQEDPCLPSQSAEPIPLGQGCSRQKFEQWSFQSESTEQRVQEFIKDA